MAKKKTKKKSGKKSKNAARKKTVKKKTARKSCARKSLTLQQKIARIRNRLPHIEPTGECKDKETGEVFFRFTEAQKVFEIYRGECEAEGLIFRPYFAVGIQPAIIPVLRGVALVAPFCIEDIKTGEILVGWGTGMGNNGDWSGNTAGTRALKQFLLTTFQATWRDPEQTEREIIRAEANQIMSVAKTTGEILTAVDELTGYFDKQFKNSKKKKRSKKNAHKK